MGAFSRMRSIDDHGVVERVAQNGQNGGERPGGDLATGDGVDAHDDEQVVELGGDGADRELPLEAERDVDQDEQKGDQAGLPHRRLDLASERRADCARTVVVDAVGIGGDREALVESGLELCLGSGVERLGLDLEAGCHPGRPDLLDHGVRIAGRGDRLAHRADVGRLGEGHDDARAGLELEAVLEAVDRDCRRRGRRGRPGRPMMIVPEIIAYHFLWPM